MLLDVLFLYSVSFHNCLYDRYGVLSEVLYLPFLKLQLIKVELFVVIPYLVQILVFLVEVLIAGSHLAICFLRVLSFHIRHITVCHFNVGIVSAVYDPGILHHFLYRSGRNRQIVRQPLDPPSVASDDLLLLPFAVIDPVCSLIQVVEFQRVIFSCLVADQSDKIFIFI